MESNFLNHMIANDNTILSMVIILMASTLCVAIIVSASLYAYKQHECLEMCNTGNKQACDYLFKDEQQP